MSGERSRNVGFYTFGVCIFLSVIVIVVGAIVMLGLLAQHVHATHPQPSATADQ